MDTDHVISVIVPAYNCGPFIRDAVGSLLSQTYPREKVEIIVVDDGSTDDTAEILSEYRGQISYYCQENQGIAGARNRGISMAHGELVTFLDADDIWYRERLRRVAEAFSVYPQAGMAYHPVAVVDRSGRLMYENFLKAFGYKDGASGIITNEILSGRVFCGGSSFTFRRRLVERVHPIPPGIRRGVDYYLSSVVSVLAHAVFIPEILGGYRFHGGNATMMAGQGSRGEIAAINADFAYARQRTLEALRSLRESEEAMVDTSIITRRQTKETIFLRVLEGKRCEGIRLIPGLFRGDLKGRDWSLAVFTTFMALLVPSSCYPVFVKAYGQLNRGRIIFSPRRRLR
ncbi:MAG TPA: glycosyltransferase [Thermodesulfovibrionales bacterium]|nr:glycosyltransferase [Thermodesulfovibrionales bacterium]